MKRFQWKWIFTGSKTCCTIWRPFWFAMVAIFKMTAKIQKSSDLDKIWFPSRSWSCELIIVIVFGIGSHRVGWCPLLLCNGNSSYYSYSLSPFFLRTMNLSTADLRNYRTEFHETSWNYRYIFLVDPKVVKGVKAIFLGVQRGWGLL